MRSALTAAIGLSALLDLVGCTPTPDVKNAPASRSPSASSTASPTAVPSPRPVAGATTLARIEPALVACYEQGRKSVPTMLDGRLTLNRAIDASSGKPTCAIVTDAKGLTQEVQDCMSARFEAEPSAASFPSVRVTVTSGELTLDTSTNDDAAGIDTVETVRMPDAFDVLESLIPELEACIRGIERTNGIRSIVVGARVGTNGKTSCVLAKSAPDRMPPAAAECSENVFRRASFPPPTKGSGLILVPLTLIRK